MAPNNFAVFILTHGRPDKVITYDTLRKCGYTGPIYLIIDNEDKTADRYFQKYGDQVIQFDKLAVAQRIDEGDNSGDRRSIVYARNASFEIAGSLGVRYFLQLDDDYFWFAYKFTADLEYKERQIKNLDAIFDAYLAFLESTPAKTIALAQMGDFIGGALGTDGKKIYLKRKAMNSFFCDTERPFEFSGRINEDVNSYVCLGHRGDLLVTFNACALHQLETQQNTGGMTDIYQAYGTYIKSFYTVLYAPSCTTIRMMGETNQRLHHRISWNNAVPKIVSEDNRVNDSS